MNKSAILVLAVGFGVVSVGCAAENAPVDSETVAEVDVDTVETKDCAPTDKLCQTGLFPPGTIRATCVSTPYSRIGTCSCPAGYNLSGMYCIPY